MTTIAVVRKNGCAAIAADTLTKWGAGKESAACVASNSKIVRVGDNWLGAAELDDSTGLPVVSHAVKRKASGHGSR